MTGAYVLDSQREDVPAGVVRAYHARTGEFLWGWNPVHPDHPAVDEEGNFVPGSTNVWSTISVDEERGLVIVPTGNSSPDYYGGARQGHLDYYSSSVVALDAATGEVRWHYQTVHHDIWDYDIPAQPTLVDLTIDGTQRPAVVQVTKMGMTFVLDLETGKPLHPVEERPVPQEGAVPGEYLSPTQPFPIKPDPLHQLTISPDDAWGGNVLGRGSVPGEAGKDAHRADLYATESGRHRVLPVSAGRQQLGRTGGGPGAQDHGGQYQAHAHRSQTHQAGRLPARIGVPATRLRLLRRHDAGYLTVGVHRAPSRRGRRWPRSIWKAATSFGKSRWERWRIWHPGRSITFSAVPSMPAVRWLPPLV